jgi:hypothetical protein
MLVNVTTNVPEILADVVKVKVMTLPLGSEFEGELEQVTVDYE